MEFITTGNRIAVENFDIGKIYTITWETGNYKSLACTGKGTDFVMFQDQEPDLLFCLTMDSAISVSSIDEGGGGSGTSNYNELNNKPQINGVTLIGNKSSADLNIYDVPAVTSENNNHILTASFSGGVGSYSWQPAQGGGGTSDYTQLSNLPQINSVELLGNKSLSDLGIASTEALAGYQPLINDLSTIRSGAAAGATAVQPATLDGYQPLINDLSTIRSGAAAGATAVQPATLAGYQTLIDSSHKLSSDLVEDTGHTNKFATASQLAQIETNKNNISITDITANFTAATGYTIQSGISSVYKQGKHVFGTLSVKIDSGNLPTTSTTIATNSTDKPNSATLLPCGCGVDEWRIDSIGTCYFSQYTGEIQCKDTVSTNKCFNLQLDYLTF